MTRDEAKNLIETLTVAMEEKAKAKDLNVEFYKESCFKIILTNLIEDYADSPKREIERWIETFKS